MMTIPVSLLMEWWSHLKQQQEVLLVERGERNHPYAVMGTDYCTSTRTSTGTRSRKCWSRQGA